MRVWDQRLDQENTVFSNKKRRCQEKYVTHERDVKFFRSVYYVFSSAYSPKRFCRAKFGLVKHVAGDAF